LKRAIERDSSNDFAWAIIGQTYMGMKKWKEAIESLNEAVELDAENS